MIVSVNAKPTFEEFKALMLKTDILLNQDALSRPDYYATRGGNPLEDDVKAALEESAKGSSFAGTIEKISGQRFPDIIAQKYYGIEVKSTKDDHWTSTGSSILETTRVSDIKRIYMTFGKLGGNPIRFLSKPYEECLYGIAVTHMPRYLINMQLKPGETIFEKIGVPYDDLRKMNNPISPVSDYYRRQLKPGERLWWMGDSTEEVVDSKVRLWKNLTPKEKKFYTIYGCVNFPEVFGGNYDNYSLWLTTQGIVNPHIRDQFSAGGKEDMILSNGTTMKFPGVYRRLKESFDLFINRISQADPSMLNQPPTIDNDTLSNRFIRWSKRVSEYSEMKYEILMNALSVLFLTYRKTQK